MQYYVGIDIGTTSTKAVAFSVEGLVLTRHQIAYPTIHRRPGFSEQDPQQVFEAVLLCMKYIKNELPGSPQFISFSAAMHSIIAVDAKGNALTPSIIWSDNRAAAIAASLRKQDESLALYQQTGVPMHAMLPLCKLIWLKENQSEIFKQASRFIGIKEYIIFNLTGQYLIDVSIAAATGLCNIHSLQWDAKALTLAGIDPTKLSAIVAATHSFALPRENLFGITGECTIVMGSSDGALANIGSEALDAATLSVTIGTSAAARIISDKPILDDAIRTFCYPIQTNQYLVGGASNNGANVIEWLKEKCFENREDYAGFLQKAESIQPGSDGLMVLPYLSGERAPLWNEAAKAVFFGVTQHHTQPHFIRAAMEAVVFNVYAITQYLQSHAAIRAISASGGFTQSKMWIQILSDLFQLPVSCKSDADASARGAVLLGMEALGMQNHFKPDTALFTVHPDAGNYASYQKSYIQFQRLVQLLKTEMQ